MKTKMTQNNVTLSSLLMRPVLVLAAVLGCAIYCHALDTFIIAEKGDAKQKVIWSGDKDFPEQDVKATWAKGAKIDAVAYTKSGWVINFTMGAPYTKQTYKLSSSFPKEWVDEQMDEDYAITSVAYGNKKWCVVMSQGSNLEHQTYTITDWFSLLRWSHNIGSRKSITTICNNGKQWFAVASEGSPYELQEIHISTHAIRTEEDVKKEIWDKGYKVLMTESGMNGVYIVYGRYEDEDRNDCDQIFSANPKDLKKEIERIRAKGYKIVGFGGGYLQNDYWL